MPVNNIPAATPLVTGSPLFGTPLEGIQIPSAIPLVPGSPLFGAPTVYFVIAAPSATALVPGSPIFGTPACAQNPIHLTVGSPIFGTPLLSAVHILTALPLVPSSPNFGSGHFHQIIQAVISGIFLPENIERDAQGGPRFNTAIFIGTNGLEYRSINWPRQLGHWTINLGYRPDTDPEYQAVLSAFYSVRGNAFGFLFKDWSDYSAANQPLGVISSGIYQLQKVYAIGSRSYIRKITRPQAGTVVIISGGAPQAATINYASGIVTDIPAGCTASFQFYVPVRFDSDMLSVEVEHAGLVNVPSIDLCEIAE